jgi:hypothetical protein
VRRLSLAVAIAAAMLSPATSEGQRRPAQLRAWHPTDALPVADQATGPGGSLLAPALSLVLPGAGQHVLGQTRKWVYMALEIGAWAFYVERRRAGGEYRDRYRDFAWAQARVQTTPRVDGDFDYYETLSHWTRSGAFDRDALAGGVQPELDAASFNGSIWSLAAAIYLAGDTGAPDTDPAYASALGYYVSRAYSMEMLWDWSGAPGAQSEYSGLVDASDRRFRQATTLLGVVIANHLFSGVDAFVSSRGGPAGTAFRFVPGRERGSTWDLVLTIPTPP